MMTLDVRTNAYPRGVIVSDLIEDVGTMAQRVRRTVIDTQERQIRDALIQLGWTPPPGSAQPTPSSVEYKL